MRKEGDGGNRWKGGGAHFGGEAQVLTIGFSWIARAHKMFWSSFPCGLHLHLHS